MESADWMDQRPIRDGLPIVRKLDKLYRIVPPREWMDMLRIGPGDSVAMYATYSGILLMPSAQRCAFCDNTEDLSAFRLGFICSDCKR